MIEYKKIIKSRKVRLAVLNALRFIPDRDMLKFQYWIKTGRRLSLDNPKRFTEKIQWYKLYYRNPLMHDCVDKYLAREYVRKKGLESILVQLYGRYDTIDDIDFDLLPNQFVIKTTNGGGGLNVVICKEKKEFIIDEIAPQLRSSEVKAKSGGREWAYYGNKPGIIVEQLLINEKNPSSGVNDYKFFCYDGEPKFIVVDVDRYTKHKRNFYDTQWNNLYITSDCPPSEKVIEKPDNLYQMLDIARTLSEGFPFARIDLYNCQGRIYFGEITFYPWSGYVSFIPDSADYLLGKDFITHC